MDTPVPENRLHVVVGVIADSRGRSLIQQRHHGTPKAWQWEFPRTRWNPENRPSSRSRVNSTGTRHRERRIDAVCEDQARLRPYPRVARYPAGDYLLRACPGSGGTVRRLGACGGNTAVRCPGSGAPHSCGLPADQPPAGGRWIGRLEDRLNGRAGIGGCQNCGFSLPGSDPALA